MSAGNFGRIEAGLTGTKEIEVVESQTIASFDANLPAVYGTPAMIMLMEWAAAAALEPHLPPGHISVGVEVSVRHLAATPLGDRVTAKAEVIEVNNNLVKFTVEARDTRQIIGSGTHTRAIIEVERFLRGLRRR
jgi:fluoroacetyl-CoA thioesterase